ncbi:unnamed protein product [Linum tenue]|uniref:Uncharacterized protein n=1 Tax=Linum tenue TaxID=586396 RepID=A0AAV0NZC7_9ROSI|nr:unnamed protein product [Linum tenue]
MVKANHRSISMYTI